MEISQIGDVIYSWDSMLSKRMKKYIHYYSIRNFVLHYEEVKSLPAQENICKLLNEYIDEVTLENFDFEGNLSLQLARKYLPKLSGYYREYSNFVGWIRIQVLLFFGLVGDVLFYFIGISKAFWHLPIVTIGLVFYYLFVLLFKKPHGRVYGIHF